MGLWAGAISWVGRLVVRMGPKGWQKINGTKDEVDGNCNGWRLKWTNQIAAEVDALHVERNRFSGLLLFIYYRIINRSEERRVGKECLL